MNTYIELAYKVAKSSTHPKHKMAAIVWRGGRILSTAWNLPEWNKCCERRALRKHEDYVGANLIVVRSNGKMSRPCQNCRVAIKAAGIKKVMYFDWNGVVIIERVADWEEEKPCDLTNYPQMNETW